jgi:hypothetical protein
MKTAEAGACSGCLPAPLKPNHVGRSEIVAMSVDRDFNRKSRMTERMPFPLVRGKSLADACDPRLDLELPDYRLVAAPEGLAVLIPTTVFEGEGPVMARKRTVKEKNSTHSKDQQLSSAFLRLKSLVSQSEWTKSRTPYEDLDRSFEAVAAEPDGREDLANSLNAIPFLTGAMGTFFSAIAMAANAQWWQLPLPHRGPAARGWFIGRWLPTALVVDGPIIRFLKSPAFRRAGGQSVAQVRAARRFLQEKTVVNFRHALAHWSFTWQTRADGNYVVCHEPDGKCFSLHQEEADAIHIVTFAIVDVLYSRCLEHPRSEGVSSNPGAAPPTKGTAGGNASCAP